MAEYEGPAREESKYEKRATAQHEAMMAEAADVRARRETNEKRLEERMEIDRQQRLQEAERFAIYADEVAHLKLHRDAVAASYEKMVTQQERAASAMEKQAEALHKIWSAMP